MIVCMYSKSVTDNYICVVLRRGCIRTYVRMYVCAMQ